MAIIDNYKRDLNEILNKVDHELESINFISYQNDRKGKYREETRDSLEVGASFLEKYESE